MSGHASQPPAKPQADTAPQAAVDPTKTHVSKTFKHTSPLISCRFDPTGKFVFAGAEDGRVWRWEIASSAQTEFHGHKSWVRAIGFSPAGETMFSGGFDGALVWWPAAAEKPAPTRTVAAHQGWIRALSVSPDGKLVATAGNDNLVKLWNTADGQPVAELAGHERHVYDVIFHPAGKDLVSGDLMGNYIHWEVASGKPLRRFAAASMHKYDPTFRADIGGPRDTSFSADGKLLACGGITNVSNAFAGVGNPIVVLFDWESAKEKNQLLAKGNLRGSNWGVAIHPQSFVIGTSGGSGGGFLLFFKPDQKNEFHRFKLPNTIRGFDLQADGMHVATAHYDKQLRISKLAAKA